MERIYVGEFASLGEFDSWLSRSNLLDKSEETWVVLTRKPRVRLDQDEVACSLRLARADAELSIVPYEQGSIFGSPFEIRWRPASVEHSAAADLKVLVEYIGRPFNEAAPLREIPLAGPSDAKVCVEDKAFILWGEQLANGLYGEGRLPAEIEYPVDVHARRVRLVSRMYVVEATGQPVARRWVRLEGIA